MLDSRMVMTGDHLHYEVVVLTVELRTRKLGCAIE